jgi:uncharacterized pyridoxal phosphate-containing UPF0001 family protein
MDNVEGLSARLDVVWNNVRAAARRAGRRPEDVQLVAVSKTVPPERVVALARLGVRFFGENRVEEAEGKLPAIEALLGAQAFTALRWCLVGHLQSRKARRAIQLFDEIHSVDTAKLAARLDRLLAPEGARLPVLLEANVSGPGRATPSSRPGCIARSRRSWGCRAWRCGD